MNGENSGFGADIFSLAARFKEERRRFCCATVIETEGSTSARSGAKALLDTEGNVVAGWVGGGCAESTVAHAALECLTSGAPQVVEIDLDDEVLGAGMPCGGRMKVYIEPVLPAPTLWLLGHGRIAECLCHFAAVLGFAVAVNDPLANRARFPDAQRLITHDNRYDTLTPEANDFVVIATQHNGDHQSLQRVLASTAGYIALIASHKRAGLVLTYLRETGIAAADIARIRAPCGLDIGARTAEEIALAVISEIVLTRRRRESGWPADATIPKRTLLKAAE